MRPCCKSCGNCYHNINRGSCTADEMVRRNGRCADWRLAKISRRPKSSRGGA